MSQLTQYLTTVSGFLEGRPSIERFVLEHGQIFKSEALSIQEAELVRSAYLRASRRCHFAAKECWWNAKDLVKADPSGELQYAEGYANYSIPTLHAWASINGKVVDLTWRKDFKRPGALDNWIIGVFAAPLEYHGIIFTAEELKTWTPKGRGALLDTWQDQWPLVRSGTFRVTTQVPEEPKLGEFPRGTRNRKT